MSSLIQVIGKGIYVVEVNSNNEILTRINSMISIPAGDNVIGKVALIDRVFLTEAQIRVADNNNYLFVQNHSSLQACIHKSIDWTGAITASTIWTPTSSQRFVVTDIIISVEEACKVKIFDHIDTPTNRLAGGVFSDTGGLVCNFSKDVYASSINNVIKITTDGGVGMAIVFGYDSNWNPPA